MQTAHIGAYYHQKASEALHYRARVAFKIFLRLARFYNGVEA
jgi:hypothetical protein